MADHPFARYADLLQRLPSLHDGLRQAESVGDLLARSARLASDECGFGRAVVLGVRDWTLTADATDPLTDPESDRLRRRVLEQPVEVRAGTLEAELVRRPDRPLGDARLPSVLIEALGLEHPAMGVVAPEQATVGLLVMDRPAGGEVDDTDRAIVALMGRMVSVVLEHVTLRARIAELSSELRFLTVSVQALAREAFDGPITLPVHGRHLPAFRGVDITEGQGAERARSVLTDRETDIARLLSRGRSNREIAEQLFLSPETVKDNVTRIMRKLGATNRVEAAVRFLGLDG